MLVTYMILYFNYTSVKKKIVTSLKKQSCLTEIEYRRVSIRWDS